VRVLEQAPALRTSGAAVTIFSNGAAASAGSGTPLDGLGGDVEELAFGTCAGSPLWRLDLRPLRRRTGFPVAAVPRRDLVARLAAGLPAGTITFGAAVTSIDAPAGDERRAEAPVQVTDGSGTTYEADVLVGADGHTSVVRQHGLSPQPARTTGWATWQGLTLVARPGPLAGLVEGRTGRFLVGSAGFVGLMPAGNGLLQWWFDVPHDPRAPLPVSPVAWLGQRFAGYGGPVPAVLEAVDDADVGLYPHVVHEVPDAWGAGAVTLLGDAAHAFPPTQAQGANQALEDAWLLTRTLTSVASDGGDGRRGPLPAALRRYEATRARRVRRVMRLAASETTNTPPGPVVRTAARLVPAGASGRAYVHLLRRCSSVLNADSP
jgi:FAD-dependent urate hydroxylase